MTAAFMVRKSTESISSRDYKEETSIQLEVSKLSLDLSVNLTEWIVELGTLNFES